MLLPAARFLQCLPHSCHSWASTKLAAESLMDLTDCGFDGFFDAEFWSIVSENSQFGPSHTDASSWQSNFASGPFFHSIKSRAGSFIKSGPTADDGILYSPPVINQLTGQEATISKAKTWFYAKVKNIGKKSKPTNKTNICMSLILQQEWERFVHSKTIRMQKGKEEDFDRLMLR